MVPVFCFRGRGHDEGQSGADGIRQRAGGPVACPPHRLDERQAVRTEPARAPRNVPSELAVLLGEIERLQGALKAEQARVAQLEAAADTDALTGIFNGAALIVSSSARSPM